MPKQGSGSLFHFVLSALLVILAGGNAFSQPQEDPATARVLEDLSALHALMDKVPDSRNTLLEWLDAESRRVQTESDRLRKQIDSLQREVEVRKGKIAMIGLRTGRDESLPLQIRSILADHCFACHGPDAGQRKAGLRLDDGRQIFQKSRSGETPVVPGDPAGSLLLKKILASNPEDRMPPPETGKSLTERDREMLVRWVSEGAPWTAHWAFVSPHKPALPTVRDPSWPKNPIDRFVLAGLDQEGLSPSPEADRHTLIRRVSQDLTGLPPSPEEVVRFVTDPDPGAYDALVDRLLASPRYGEHMARYWLDLARYADTNGYAADIERTMWRYRDWVIEAINANMPFDRFTLEQLAGDLLPNPTLGQRIATGFNRNHPIMMEGGAIFEEYRVENVVDRVDTTATTWLGLTMKCAQCHDHKYDPISQREFYSFYSFFNNVPEEESKLFGTELDGNSLPRINAPLPAQQEEFDRIDRALDEVRAEMLCPIPEVDRLQEAWEETERTAAGAQWIPVETVVASVSSESELDTIALRGETTVGDITALRVDLVGNENDEDPVAFSLAELKLFIAPVEAASEETQIGFANASGLDVDGKTLLDANTETRWDERSSTSPFRATFATAAPFGFGDRTRVRVVLRGDGLPSVMGRLRIHVSNDPAFLPSTQSSWHLNGPFVAEDGDQALTTEQVDPNDIDLSSTYEDGRAKWTTVPGGLPDGTAHRLSGKMCATYFHRTLTAPSARRMEISLDNRNAVRLWVNGRLVFDKEAQRGEVGAHPAPATLALRQGVNTILIKTVDYYDFNEPTFYFARTGEEVGRWPQLVEDALLLKPTERTEEQSLALRTFYRSRSWDGWQALLDRQLDLEWERGVLEKQIPTTMVMEELEAPRPAHVLIRGQYDQPSDPVSPGVPSALHPWPEGAPHNRLGLAQWLVAPENPLTARVTVNRAWQRYFGTGFVATPDDFGAQGAGPTHPELLDWLAREFIDSGWDVKALQKLIVTSATYRQNSRLRPDLIERDPTNSLLARGPRYRLEAEQVRDQALAASGLLVDTLGGPSVKPYQPPGLWRDVAYGGGGQRYTAQEFVQDRGEKLYRRSLYTFWKRAAAPPSMLLFDAPNRDVCTALRSRSNTPLQALVLMNDTQFVEAARALAGRILKESGPGIEERLAYAGMLVLGRPVRPAEEIALRKQFEAQYADYSQAPETAGALLATGESDFDKSLDPAEFAAWTMVASALMNTDAAVSKF